MLYEDADRSGGVEYHRLGRVSGIPFTRAFSVTSIWLEGQINEAVRDDRCQGNGEQFPNQEFPPFRSLMYSVSRSIHLSSPLSLGEMTAGNQAGFRSYKQRAGVSSNAKLFR